MRRLRQVRDFFRDDNFLQFVEDVEGVLSKALSIAMLVVIFVAVIDLLVFMATDLWAYPTGRFTTTLTVIFGLFLNVLIAMEILENITAYLRKHVIQLELVITTSLVAVSRKIIILDLEKTAGIDLIALATAIVSLSVSYWLIRRANRHMDDLPHKSDRSHKKDASKD
jgi:uncharacterized membrane protein (DUF373 family)